MLGACKMPNKCLLSHFTDEDSKNKRGCLQLPEITQQASGLKSKAHVFYTDAYRGNFTFLKSGTVPALSTLLQDPRDFWTWTGALHCLWVWCFWVWMSVFVSVFTDAHDSGSYPSIPPRGGQGPFVLHGLFDGSRVLLFKEKSSQTNLDLALSKSFEFRECFLHRSSRRTSQSLRDLRGVFPVDQWFSNLTLA